MTMSSTFVGKVMIATCVSVLLLCSYSSAWGILPFLHRHLQSPHQVKVKPTEFYEVKQPLTVSLYYESFCSGCEEFIFDQLCPVWEKMGDYFKVELVPYGNTETKTSYIGEITYKCQHGQAECAANIMHACALNHLSYKDSLKFICCMVGKYSAPGSGEKCAKNLAIDYRPINTCANGPEGVQLYSLYGLKTSDLKPKHEFLPWILFDGKLNKKEMVIGQNDLLKIICKYIKPIKGHKPKECKNV